MCPGLNLTVPAGRQLDELLLLRSHCLLLRFDPCRDFDTLSLFSFKTGMLFLTFTIYPYLILELLILRASLSLLVKLNCLKNVTVAPCYSLL